MSYERFPCFVNMVSLQPDMTPEKIRQRHASHLQYHNATEADCQLINPELRTNYNYRGVLHTEVQYRLNINNYVGWKVYMLHTGGFGSLPKYELLCDFTKTPCYNRRFCFCENCKKFANWRD